MRPVARCLLAVAVLVLPACGSPADPPPPTTLEAVEDTGQPEADDAPTATEDPRPGSPRRRAQPPDPAPSLDPGLGDLARLAEQQAEERAGGTTTPVLGGDVSWPQCPRGMGIPERRTLGLPMPLPEAKYVVVGLTNGPAFTDNPCLADQVDWVRSRGLLLSAYAVTSYPDDRTLARERDEGPYDGGTTSGALRNVGYQQARFGVSAMRRAGLTTPTVWVDVEPVSDFEWSGDPVANTSVVVGVVEGYRDAGYRVGVYSTPYLWEQIVGDLALGLPEWRAAGQTSAEEALARCEEDWSIQGGEPVLGQWVEQGRDQNLTCPGIDPRDGRWFTDTGR